MVRGHRNWRNSWLGRILGIHSPTAHAMEECWCRGTKRELKDPPGFATVSRVQTDIAAYLLFVNQALDCSDSLCNYFEPHKHGFACDVTCQTCKWITAVEEYG